MTAAQDGEGKRLSLKPLSEDDALAALLATPPPPKDEPAKRGKRKPTAPDKD